jgi:hypothetical protein
VKLRKKQKKDLAADIVRLKSIENPDWDRIFELESYLDKLADTELTFELQKFTGFELLHDEKITPFF